MNATRRDVLTVGVVGFGAAARLLAVEEQGQPGDEVGPEERRARFMELMARFGDDPVDMLNLLKFKPGGEESYLRYGMEFGKLIAKYAPETHIAYQGDCAGLLVGDGEWDRIIIVRYPSMKAFLAITQSADYAEIADLRLDGLERTVLYAIEPQGAS